jgi:hypothetical protein
MLTPLANFSSFVPGPSIKPKLSSLATPDFMLGPKLEEVFDFFRYFQNYEPLGPQLRKYQKQLDTWLARVEPRSRSHFDIISKLT